MDIWAREGLKRRNKAPMNCSLITGLRADALLLPEIAPVVLAAS